MVTVDLFTMGYNEEKILPHFIKHYKQFCRNITFYNNCSTDSSVDICKGNGVQVIDTGLDEINEIEYLKIKQNSYLNSDADFVIVVDTDEFVHHPDMLKLLELYKKENVTLPKVRGYNMATDKGYPNEGLMVDSIKTGLPAWSYAKRCIFNPVLKINWCAGMHYITNCVGPIKESDQADISLYHYKFIDREELHKKKKAYSERMSKFNLQNNLGSYYFSYDYEETEKWIDSFIRDSIKVM